MQKDLADVITELSQAGTTGILTLSIRNHASLFKIFFRKGTIYHATCSTFKGNDCFSKIKDHDFVTGVFMPGAHVDIDNPSLMPLQEIVSLVKDAGKSIEWSGNWNGRAGNPAASGMFSTGSDQIMARIEEELLSRIGPVATMVLANALATAGVKEGMVPTKAELQHLLKIISDQLPPEQRAPFLKNFA